MSRDVYLASENISVRTSFRKHLWGAFDNDSQQLSNKLWRVYESSQYFTAFCIFVIESLLISKLWFSV